LCLQEPSNETYKKALEMCKKVRLAQCCSHMPAYISHRMQCVDLAYGKRAPIIASSNFGCSIEALLLSCVVGCQRQCC
jgi:hypothetical protein